MASYSSDGDFSEHGSDAAHAERLRRLAESMLAALPADESTVAEADQLAEERRTAELTASIAAAKKARAPAAANGIPTFYRRSVVTAEAYPEPSRSANAHGGGDSDAGGSSPGGGGRSPSPPHANDFITAEGVAPVSGHALRYLMKGAARCVEVERYLELIEAWEAFPPSMVWETLKGVKQEEVAAAEAYENDKGPEAALRDLPAGALSMGDMSYPTFQKAIRVFQAKVHEEHEPTAARRLCELVTGVPSPDSNPDDGDGSSPSKAGNKDSDALHLPLEAYFVPKLDVSLFLSCTRKPNGTVEFTALYAALMVQLSLFKTTAELIMRDSDSDGRLSEIELEDYAAGLCKQVPGLAETIPEDLIPFYACMVARRLLWAVEGAANLPEDTTLTNSYAAPEASKASTSLERSGAAGGTLRLNKLLEHAELRFWIEAQLGLGDGKDGWYSASNFMNLYDKFCGLDRRATGMLERGDFAGYKKGVPAVTNDGLPPGTCPISELFIDRYFELTPTFSGEMDFKCFVDFTLNVEFLPAKCHRPGLFFDIFDLDGDGVITPTDIQFFFRETRAKLVAAGLQDTVPVELFVREVFDALEPATSLTCTRDEFIRSRSAGVVAGTVIDPLAFFAYDSRDNDVGTKQQQLYQYEQPLLR